MTDAIINLTILYIGRLPQISQLNCVFGTSQHSRLGASDLSWIIQALPTKKK